MAEVKQMKELQITVDDGSKRVPIKNTHGDEIGVFYFRPTDVGIVDRYNEIIEKFDEIVAPLDQINISAKGDATDEAGAKALKEAEMKLYAACDYMFNGNMSEAFFGNMNPFSPVNGNFYCENAINAVGSFISQQFTKETKKVDRRVNKYLGQYQPKGKKKGNRK